MSRCPVCRRHDDENLHAVARRVAAVDRAVLAYRRKLDGKRPFTDFAAMVPKELRG